MNPTITCIKVGFKRCSIHDLVSAMVLEAKHSRCQQTVQSAVQCDLNVRQVNMFEVTFYRTLSYQILSKIRICVVNMFIVFVLINVSLLSECEVVNT